LCASANSRHSCRTPQPAQIVLAAAICAAGAVTESGKNKSGSADRQAAADRQFWSLPVAVIACPHEVFTGFGTGFAINLTLTLGCPAKRGLNVTILTSAHVYSL
jgi:hypothetical protein